MIASAILRSGLMAALSVVPVSMASEPGASDRLCPDPATTLAFLEGVDRTAASRIARFGEPLPAGLLESAVRSPGRGFTKREGRTVHGTLLVEMPVATFWKAVNDEEHFDLDERYLPLRRSDVIAGSPRGERRTVFQVFRKLGISRWWVSEVVVSRELYRASGGRLWEVSWSDVMSSIDEPDPELRAVTDSVKPLRASHGAWLLVPIREQCTFVDYLVHVDPGGFVGAVQAMFAARAVRETLEGVVRLASEHVPIAHADDAFLRPDGTLLD